MMPLRIFAVLSTLILAAAVARAEDAAAGWVLTTADFRSAEVTLKSIDASGVHVAGDANQPGSDRVVGMDEFLQLERPMPASVAAAQQGKFVLHLAGGDEVAGEPASVRGEQLVWNNAAAGEVRVPMSRAVAITRPGQSAPDRRPAEDVVTLANGDAVRGIIAGIEGGKISVQRTDSPDPLAVPVDSVASVQFAATGGAGAAGAASGKRAFRLRLGDGSSLPAATLTLAAGKLSADLGDGKPRPFPAHNLAFVVTGTFILLFGWMGFNPGSTLGATDLRIGVVAINTNLAAVAGSATAMLLWYRMFATPA